MNCIYGHFKHNHIKHVYKSSGKVSFMMGKNVIEKMTIKLMQIKYL